MIIVECKCKYFVYIQTYYFSLFVYFIYINDSSQEMENNNKEDRQQINFKKRKHRQ